MFKEFLPEMVRKLRFWLHQKSAICQSQVALLFPQSRDPLAKKRFLKHLRHVALFLFSLHSLSASEEAFPTLIHNVVDPISGQYSITKEDITISGPVPLVFKRCYIGTHENEKDDGWSFFPHIHLDEIEREKSHKFSLILREERGSTLRFRSLKEKSREDFVLDTMKSLFHLNSEEIFRGPTHPKSVKISWNQKTQTYLLTLENGRQRLYGSPRLVTKENEKESKKEVKRRYLLLQESLPSGHKIRYLYDNRERPVKIWTTNPKESKVYNFLRFEYKTNSDDITSFKVFTSDGRQYVYSYQTHHASDPEKSHSRLHEVSGSDIPTEVIFYQKIVKQMMPKLHTITEHHNHFIAAEYYVLGPNNVNGTRIEIKSEKDPRLGRIRALKVPVGLEGEYKEIYHFYYHLGRVDSWGRGVSGKTEVVRTDGARTVYTYFPDRRLRSIESYFHNEYLGKKLFAWSQGAEGDILKGVAIYDREKPLLATTYRYDDMGNLTEEATWGEITGTNRVQLEIDFDGLPIENGVDRKVVRSSYSNDHKLITREFPNGLTHSYTYLPDTNIIVAKLIAHDGIIKRRNFYIFNDDHELVRKIKDNGASRDSEDLEGISHRLIYDYEREKGNVVALNESYFDCEKSEIFPLKSQRYTYNNRHNILRQDLYDAEGNWSSALSYKYDQWGNQIEVINELDEICSRTYDSYGCMTRESWGSGLVKDYLYDFNRHPLHELFSLSNGARYKKRFDYNCFGHLNGESDLSGNWTNYEHDAQGKVCAVLTPPVEQRDGSIKSNRRSEKSNILGHSIYSIDPLGYLTRYEMNIEGKPLTISNPKGQSEVYTYDLKGNKLSYKDFGGNIYLYSYDPFDRLTHVIYPDGTEETYEYDGFFLTKSVDIYGTETRFSYDGAGRLIEENESDIVRSYDYDTLSRQVRVCEKIGENFYRIISYEYDALNRVISKRDEDGEGRVFSTVEYEYGPYNLSFTQKNNGAVTKQRFDELGRVLEETDPAGRLTLFSYDSHYLNDLNDCVQKRTSIDPEGKKSEEIFDVCGRLSLKKEYSSRGDLISREKFVYDARGDIATKIEERLGEEEEVTEYRPNFQGLPSTVVSADGKTYRYEYDAFGRTKCAIKPDGVKLFHSYDFRGRLLSLSSSDGTVDILFEYGAHSDPIAITDLVGGGVTYRHYDARGNLLSETLPTGVTLSTRYDELNRPTVKTLPDTSEIAYGYDSYYLRSVARKTQNRSYSHLFLKYDERGNSIEESMIFGSGMLMRDYDELGQIVAFDTPYARERHTFTDENSQEGECFLEIDFKERRRTIKAEGESQESASDETPVVSYDALDRPILITSRTAQSHLFYDGLSRLIAKETISLINGVWQELPREIFIYDNKIQIGKIEGKAIKQLRIVKPSSNEAVAYELEQKPFVPIFSLEGDLLTLVDPQMRANAYVFAFQKKGEWENLPLLRDLWSSQEEKRDERR